MSEKCAHNWVKAADVIDGEQQAYCSKCDVERFECWCGAKGSYDELFNSEALSRSCHGTGMLDCHCGGDLCVCHNHGEIDCPGCRDCDDDDGEDWDEWDVYEEDCPQDLEMTLDTALESAPQNRGEIP